MSAITDRLDLSGWPQGCRVIVRRERPHPGAQLSFTDHDGHRFLATLTDLAGDSVEPECQHRARASVEDRVRAAKQTGLDNLPFRDFDHNAVWLELSLIAQDLVAWTQLLALDGELAVCEPKTLRYRLLHTAARLAFHARRAILRLHRTWPWADALAAAFTRLAALPPPGSLNPHRTADHHHDHADPPAYHRRPKRCQPTPATPATTLTRTRCRSINPDTSSTTHPKPRGDPVTATPGEPRARSGLAEACRASAEMTACVSAQPGSLRLAGLHGVRTEWRLLMLTHNLTKLHRHRLAAVGA